MKKESKKLVILGMIFFLILGILVSGQNSSNFSIKEETIENKTEINSTKNTENSYEYEDKNQTSIRIDNDSENNDDLFIDIDEINKQDYENKTNSSDNSEEKENLQLKNNTKNNTDIENSSNNSIENKTNFSDSIIQKDSDSSDTKNSSEENKDSEINNSEKNSGEEDEKKEERPIKRTLYKEGEKELEFETLGEEEVDIQKKETTEDESRKQIKVFSKEHFNNPVRVYSALPKETKKENIKIYWKNKNRDITNIPEFEVNYYDKDDNGMIERISWLVPHLSEQYFEIVINSENISEKEGVENILLDVQGPSGDSTNPLDFKIDLEYKNLSKINCSIEIFDEINNSKGKETGHIEKETTSFVWNNSIENGNYQWNISCWDINNSEIKNSSSGNFIINEAFDISLNEKVYLSDENPVIDIIGNNGNASIKIIKPNGTSKTLGKIDVVSEENFEISSSELNLPGLYQIEVSFDALNNIIVETANFTVIDAEIEVSDEEITTNDEIEVSVRIDSGEYGEEIRGPTIFFGDGTSNSNNYDYKGNYFEEVFTKRYSEEGNYLIELKFYVDGSEHFTISTNKIKVESGEDIEKPNVRLLYPDDEEIIEDTKIDFEYKVTDNIKVERCEFKLYNTTNYGVSDDIIWGKNYSDIKNNTENIIKMVEFEEGYYFWEIVCWDNSSNYDEEIYIFEVDLNSSANSFSSDSEPYEKEDTVNYLIEKVNDFLGGSSDYGPEEQEVLEDLEIIKEMEYYKKRLVQIDQDLSHNFNFMSDENLKEERIQEVYDELDEMIGNIPIEIKVIDSEEYIKNSFSHEMEEIIKEYLDSTNTNMEKRAIEKLAEYNTQNQNKIKSKVDVKKVEIKYNKSKEEITLVKKQLEFINETNGVIFEIFPEEIQGKEIEFLQKQKSIKEESIYEFEPYEIEEKIVYTINDYIDIEKIKKTDTLLFEDKIPKGTDISITGFSVLGVFEGDNPIYYFFAALLIIVFIYLFSFILKKFQADAYKKDPVVYRVLDLLSDAKKGLRENDIERARENYKQMREEYKILPPKAKGFVFQKIKALEKAIDRRGIFNLVKEYEDAKKSWRKEDAQRLYKNIQKIYLRLPDKDREQVYQRVFKNY